MGTRALPDMYALNPRTSGIYIRQNTRSHVITITCNFKHFIIEILNAVYSYFLYTFQTTKD